MRQVPHPEGEPQAPTAPVKPACRQTSHRETHKERPFGWELFFALRIRDGTLKGYQHKIPIVSAADPAYHIAWFQDVPRLKRTQGEEHPPPFGRSRSSRPTLGAATLGATGHRIQNHRPDERYVLPGLDELSFGDLHM